MRNIENITEVYKIIYYIQNKTNYLNMDQIQNIESKGKFLLTIYYKLLKYLNEIFVRNIW